MEGCLLQYLRKDVPYLGMQQKINKVDRHILLLLAHSPPSPVLSCPVRFQKQTLLDQSVRQAFFRQAGIQSAVADTRVCFVVVFLASGVEVVAGDGGGCVYRGWVIIDWLDGGWMDGVERL